MEQGLSSKGQKARSTLFGVSAESYDGGWATRVSAEFQITSATRPCPNQRLSHAADRQTLFLTEEAAATHQNTPKRTKVPGKNRTHCSRLLAALLINHRLHKVHHVGMRCRGLLVIQCLLHLGPKPGIMGRHLTGHGDGPRGAYPEARLGLSA